MDQKQKQAKQVKMKRLLEAHHNLKQKIKTAEKDQEKKSRLTKTKLAVQRQLMEKYDTDVNNGKFMSNIDVHYKKLPEDIKKDIRTKFLAGVKKHFSGIYEDALEWIDHLERPTVSPPKIPKKALFYVFISMILLGIVVYNNFVTCKSYELVKGLFGVGSYWEQHTNETCVRWKNQSTLIGSVLALLVNLLAFIGGDFVKLFEKFFGYSKESRMLALLSFYIISFLSVFYISQVQINQLGALEAAFYGHKLSKFLSNREVMTAIATAYGSLGLPTLGDIISSSKEYVRGPPPPPTRGVVHVIPYDD